MVKAETARRISVFCCTFIVACAMGLAYVYTRPPEYRAAAKLEIFPGASVSDENDNTKSPAIKDVPQAFLTAIQGMTSRPLLETVVADLKKSGKLPDLGSDTVTAIQAMLQVKPVEDTEVVEVSAIGPEPLFASDLVNSLVDAYRKKIIASYKFRSEEDYSAVSAEVNSLEVQVQAKATAAESFRERNDIVSLQHEENDVLATISQLSQTYAQSNQKLAAAQGHLKALQESEAAGRSVVRAKDNPTLANLEQRTSSLREQLRDLQRRYTPDYLALDADARALQARVSNLEDQLRTERSAAEKQALSEAQDDVSSAEAEVTRLRTDLARNRIAAEQFASRLQQFKALEDDLNHLQAMQRLAEDRLSKLRASERERAPRIEVVEPAAPERTVWRPLYTMDASFTVGGSLALAVFAVWLIEYVLGPRPTVATVVHHAAAAPILERYQPLVSPVLNSPKLLQIEAPEPLKRELRDDEIVALIANGSDDARLLVSALLSGISLPDIINLRWSDVDPCGSVMTLTGQPPRTVPLEEPMAALLSARPDRGREEARTVLCDAQGAALSSDDVDRIVLFSAFDAGLERPEEITAEALRRTYLLFLLRQGVRASEIGRIAGAVTQLELVGYMRQVPPAPRLPLDRIVRVHPAIGQRMSAS